MLFSSCRCSSLMHHFTVEFHSSKVIFNCEHREKAEKNWFPGRWAEFENFIRFIQNWEKRQLNVCTINRPNIHRVVFASRVLECAPFRLSIFNDTNYRVLWAIFAMSSHAISWQFLSISVSRAWQSPGRAVLQVTMSQRLNVQTFCGCLFKRLIDFLFGNLTLFATCCFGIWFAMQTQRLDSPNGFFFPTHWKA